jgi:uncharacterized DUF497 family protein
MFEFDSAKSVSNLAKHGIDFEEAQKLWLDPRRIQFEARSDLEPRGAMLAKLNAKIWFAVYTQRNRKTRIISVRRARKKEEAIYEKN